MTVPVFHAMGGVLKRLGRADREPGTAPPTVHPVLLPNADQVTINGQSWTSQSPGKSYSVQVDGDPGPMYARFEIRAGDRWINDINLHPNDERQRAMLRGATFYPLNTDVWTSVAIRINTAAWKSRAGSFNIFYDFFQQAEAGEAGNKNGPLQFDMLGPDGIVQVQTYGDPTGAATTVIDREETTREASYVWPMNEWVHIVTRCRFHWTNGQFQMWRNGVEVMNVGPIVFGYNDTLGPYFKIGMYREGFTETVVVEYANLELGTSSLAHRVGAPLPIPIVN